MSDLVAYVVGNTVDRDVINWPTITEDDIGFIFPTMTDAERDAIWPLYISSAQVRALAWRIRKWTLSGNLTCTINYDDPGVQAITATGTSELTDLNIYTLIEGDPDEVHATTESHLVSRVFDPIYRALVNNGIAPIPDTGPEFTWTIEGEDDFGGGPIPFSQDGTFTSPPGAFRIFSEFVLYDEDDKTFAPKFQGFGHVIPSIFLERLFMDADFERNPVTDLSGVAPFLLKAPGILTVSPGIAPDFEVPIQLSWRLTDQTPGANITGTATGEFTLEATEFWPGKNSQGLPVYDTADGSELRNPFS